MGVDMDDQTVSADAFGRSLAGFGINLLTRDVAAECAFLERCLGFQTTRANADFAILRRGEMVMMLHHDRTYKGHPSIDLLPEAGARGAGAELHLYDCNPDRAVRAAEAAGGAILQEPRDKPHGLREAFILSPAGYVWVPSQPLE